MNRYLTQEALNQISRRVTELHYTINNENLPENIRETAAAEYQSLQESITTPPPTPFGGHDYEEGNDDKFWNERRNQG